MHIDDLVVNIRGTPSNREYVATRVVVVGQRLLFFVCAFVFRVQIQLAHDSANRCLFHRSGRLGFGGWRVWQGGGAGVPQGGAMCFLRGVQQTVSGNKPSQYPPDTNRWTLFRCSLRGVNRVQRSSLRG